MFQEFLWNSLPSFRGSCKRRSRRGYNLGQPSSSGSSSIWLHSWTEPQSLAGAQLCITGRTGPSQPPWALPATQFFPYLGNTGLSREIWTLLLTLTLAEEFFSRLLACKHLLLEEACKHSGGISPQLPLTVSALVAKHRQKPLPKRQFHSIFLCKLGQSKVPAELWRSVRVEELNVSCASSRAQALMAAVWLHLSHSVQATNWQMNTVGLQGQTDQTPVRSTHPNLDVSIQEWALSFYVKDTFSISLLSCSLVCPTTTLRAHAEVLI